MFGTAHTAIVKQMPILLNSRVLVVTKMNLFTKSLYAAVYTFQNQSCTRVKLGLLIKMFGAQLTSRH
jgi:hypothetical protein